ncbi:MAG TPA: TraR/DksA family transcriptional regulator [Pyrinomonadaceae bacterium]|jgi:DnaK suppressor protein|nr:TraR/DksA family transcriptional regulator [Pyrinomonadaceae bacterium]
MQPEKLARFKTILLDELKKHTEHVRDDQAAALELSDDGVKDTVDMSLMDVNKEMALRLGERESQMIADIDQALLRIEEGSYGKCARCGELIDERRLEALPTARYDAACQAIIEADNGEDEHSTL